MTHPSEPTEYTSQGKRTTTVIKTFEYDGEGRVAKETTVTITSDLSSETR